MYNYVDGDNGGLYDDGGYDGNVNVIVNGNSWYYYELLQ